MAIESRIDIVVRNLNKLNDVSKSLQEIQKSNEQLVKGLNRVETKLNDINRKGGGVFSSISREANAASRSVSDLARSIGGLGKRGIGGQAGGGGGFLSGILGGIGGAGAAISVGFKSFVDAASSAGEQVTNSLKNIPMLGEGVSSLTQSFTQSITPTNAFAKALYGVGDQLMAHPQLYGAVAVALMAFAGPLKNVAVSGLGNLAKALKQNGQELNGAFKAGIFNSVEGLQQFEVVTLSAVEQLRNLIKGASLSELTDQVNKAKREMEGFWHMTGGAEEAAEKLAIALRAQKLEQRALNDLLLKAQGKATSFEQYQNKNALAEQKAAALEADKVWRARAEEYELAQKITAERKREAKEAARIKRFGEMTQKQRRRDKQAAIDSRFRENMMLGVGFPLLFGGGVGSVAGGAGGAMLQKKMGTQGGFGAQILLSALGQQFDALISSMVSSTQKLGNALGQYTQDTGQLVESLGLAGTAEGQRIKIIEELQGANAAFTAAMRELTNAVGAKGVADLKEFGDNWRVVSSEFKIFFTQVQAGIANLINAADKFFGVSEGAKETRLERFIKTTDDPEIKRLREQRAGLDANKVKGGELVGGFLTGTDIVEASKLDEQMNKLGAVALARQDAGTAVKTIMMEQEKMNKSIEEEFAIHSKILDLKKEHGLTDEVAKAVAQEALIIDRSSVALQAKLDELKAKGNTLSLEDKELQKAIEAALNGQKAALEEIIKKKKTINAEDEKNKVTIEDIKEKLATGLQSAIEGLIDGTKTLGESLAGIAKSIGSMFLQAGIRSMFGLAEGGYATGGIKAFSSGGLVTRPTIGLVGEAGEDEYIIPASKMSGAMDRYSAGARGQAVIPGSGTVASGSGVSSTPTVVNYTGPVLSFNSEAYVPKSAIPEIINSAARRGAQEGESKVFSKLKNSRSQRSRVGM